MKIATWNIERLKHKTNLATITSILNGLQADILVLTETDKQVVLSNYPYCISTPALISDEPQNYLPTENRVTIYSKYEIVNQYATFNEYTSLCVTLKTEQGDLVVYGTIMGVYGNRHADFKTDLAQQIIDFDKFSTHNNLCIVGDYNISFNDNYYFTNWGREQLLDSFNKHNIELITSQMPACIDHIAMSIFFLNKRKVLVTDWFYSKLSDHKGVLVEIE
ncbi:MAG: endonuclease/exonuclease/phosphatase family protein [Bacteroidota bacterium]